LAQAAPKHKQVCLQWQDEPEHHDIEWKSRCRAY
jgi:hypothetical protein